MADEITSIEAEGQGSARTKPKLSAEDRGLAMIRLVYRRKYTTVSMDLELWQLLCEELAGSEAEAKRWVSEQARLIEGLAETSTGVEAKGAGLSRLIQRRVYEWVRRRLRVAKT